MLQFNDFYDFPIFHAGWFHDTVSSVNILIYFYNEYI